MFPFSFFSTAQIFASDQFDQILSQFSKAVAQVIRTPCPKFDHLKLLQNHIRNSGMRTRRLTEMAYEWCSLACSNLSVMEDRGYPFLLSLEIGFRHLDPGKQWIEAELTHREHHWKLVTVVFRSGDGEAIADLLHAWTSGSSSHAPPSSLKMCARYLIGLHNLQPFSPRLRWHIITAVGLIGYQPFEQTGIEGFIGLLNILEVSAEEARNRFIWAQLLLDVIQSPAKIQHLSLSYWELMEKLAPFWSSELADRTTYNPHTIAFLEGSGEWDKLKCWLFVVWTVWPPESDQTMEENLEHAMLSLSYQQPGAIQELKGQLEKYDGVCSWITIPESFQQICKKVHEKVAQQATL